MLNSKMILVPHRVPPRRHPTSPAIRQAYVGAAAIPNPIPGLVSERNDGVLGLFCAHCLG